MLLTDLRQTSIRRHLEVKRAQNINIRAHLSHLEYSQVIALEESDSSKVT